MLRSFLKLFVFGSLALYIACVWFSEDLPSPVGLDPSLLEEPRQTRIDQNPFDTEVGGITYTVKPLYDYDIAGLVVSRHDTGGWLGILHKEANDKLNVADLCVVWGNNVRSGAYQNVKFWNGQFTCNVEPSSMEAYTSFDENAISNNHVLTANADTAKRIRAARPGDQIRIRGSLAEYSHNHGFAYKRGTSTVRTDQGNGACETLFVNDFKIIKEGGGAWRKFRWLAGALFLLSLVAWFCQPVRFYQ